MDTQAIWTDAAPVTIGPCAQAIRTRGLIYTAGQIGLDPKSGNLVPGGIAEETRQVMDNLRAVLEAGGSSLNRVLKATVFMKNMRDFPAMNKVYEEYLGSAKPARSTVAVSELPGNALVQIDLIALRDGSP